MAAEYGLFSGEGAHTDPQSFRIKRTLAQKNGSFRVYVNLTGGKPPYGPWEWRVAAVVVLEDNRYVLDDVIYINDATYDRRRTSRLTGACRSIYPRDATALTGAGIACPISPRLWSEASIGTWSLVLLAAFHRARTGRFSRHI